MRDGDRMLEEKCLDDAGERDELVFRLNAVERERDELLLQVEPLQAKVNYYESTVCFDSKLWAIRTEAGQAICKAIDPGKIAGVLADRDSLRGKLAEAGAGAAAMREALEFGKGVIGVFAEFVPDRIADAKKHIEFINMANRAMRASAGRDLLERVKEMEGKVELAKQTLENFLWVNVDDGPKERIPDCEKARAAYVALGGVIPAPDDDDEDDPGSDNSEAPGCVENEEPKEEK